MKRFLLFIIFLLIALLLIFNWKNREEIITNIKQTFNKEHIQCSIQEKYQEGKKWVQEKVTHH